MHKLPECKNEDLLTAAEYLDAFSHSDNPADQTKKISFTKVAAMLRKTVSVRNREAIERSAKPSVK